jgi:CcmD family protein
MTKFQYLTLGYALIWIALGFFLVSMNGRIKRLSELLRELRDRAGSQR